MATEIGHGVITVGFDPSSIQSGLTGLTSLVHTKLGAMGTVGGGLLVAGIAGAVAGAKGLYSIGKTFDDMSDTIVTKTGASGKALRGLEKDALAVGKTTPSTFKEIGTAIGEMAARTGASGKPLQETTKNILNLSRITGTDLSTNIKNMTRLFGDWSIPTGKQAFALDKLYTASQKTGIGVDDLSRLMVQFGSPLRQLGMDFDTTAAMFAKFEKEGVNITTALPGLRMGLKNLVKAQEDLPKAQATAEIQQNKYTEAIKKFGPGSSEAAVELAKLQDANEALKLSTMASGKSIPEAMAEVFNAIKNAGSTAEANMLAFKVFGTRAGPDMAAAIREGRFELDDLVGTLQNSKGAIDKADKGTRDFDESWQIIKNNTLIPLKPLAEGVFSAVGDASVKVAEAMPGILSTIGSAWKAMFSGGGAGGSIAATLGETFSLLINVFKALMPTLIQAGQDIWKALGPAFKTIGDMITQVLIPAINMILPVVVPVVQWLVDAFSNVLVAAIQTIVGVLTGLINIIAGVFKVIKAIVTGDWSLLWEGLVQILHGFIQVVLGILNGLWDLISAVFQAGWQVIQAIWNGIWNGLTAVVSAVWNGIVNVIQGAWNAIVAILNGIGNFLSTVFGPAWGVITTVVGAVWNGLAAIIQGAWNVILGILQAIGNFIRTVFLLEWQGITTIVSAVWNGLGPVIQGAWNIILGILNAIGSFLSTVFAGFWNVVTTVVSTVWNGLSAIIQGAWNVILGILTGIGNFIQTVFTAYWNVVTTVVTTVWNGLSAIIQGAWNVILGILNAIGSFLSTVFAAFWTGITTVVTTVWNGLSAVIQGAWNVILGILNAIGAFLSGVFTVAWQTMQTAVSAVWTAIQTAISTAWSAILTVLQAIGNFLATVFTVYWQTMSTAVATVWNAIKTAITTTWAAIQTALAAAGAWLASTFTAFWNTLQAAITTVWNAIKTAITTTWAAIQAALATAGAWLASTFTAFWTTLQSSITTVWNAIKSAISSTWTAIQGALQAAGTWITGTFVGFWNTMSSAVSKVWDGLKTALSNTWENGIKPIFTSISDFITKTIPTAFEKGVTAVGATWKKLQELAAVPVRWVITHVYNNGIVRVVNAIPGLSGTLSTISVNFAEGGVLPGYTPGRDVHRFTSPTGGTLMLSGGEAIMRPEFVRKMGGPKAIEAMNEWAKKHPHAPHSRLGRRPPSEVPSWHHVRRMAGGGVLRLGSTPPVPGPWNFDANDSGGNRTSYDIPVPVGTPVHAYESGTVASVQNLDGISYGLYIIVNQADGSSAYYAHLSGTRVSPGDHVAEGQIIGASGNSGKTTGPHLHFEIRNGELSPIGGGGGVAGAIAAIIPTIGDFIGGLFNGIKTVAGLFDFGSWGNTLSGMGVWGGYMAKMIATWVSPVINFATAAIQKAYDLFLSKIPVVGEIGQTVVDVVKIGINALGNLFDSGGILHHGHIARNKTGKPERILDPRTTQNFELLVSMLNQGKVLAAPGLAVAALAQAAAHDEERGGGTSLDEVVKELNELRRELRGMPRDYRMADRKGLR